MVHPHGWLVPRRPCRRCRLFSFLILVLLKESLLDSDVMTEVELR